MRLRLYLDANAHNVANLVMDDLNFIEGIIDFSPNLL
jgi:hypothetical protein